MVLRGYYWMICFWRNLKKTIKIKITHISLTSDKYINYWKAFRYEETPDMLRILRFIRQRTANIKWNVTAGIKRFMVSFQFT